MRRLLALLAVIVAALVAAPAAHAGQAVDQAAAALASDNVYVAPGAHDVLSRADADRVRRRIVDKHAGPMYVAVLTPAALQQDGGSINAVLNDLFHTVGRHGVYAVVIDHQFAAGGSDFSVRGAADASQQAESGNGAAAVLLDFTNRVADLSSGERSSGGEGESGGAMGIVVLVIVVLGLGAFLLSRRRRRRQRDDEFAEVKENTRDDLVALGDDIRALDLDMEMPGVDPQVRETYGQAVDAYDRANSAWERARGPEDLEPVGAALEEGRWAMTATKARMEGRPVPERRPPCFFDPRHGPSSREVEWAPDGGAPRLVPACEADAQRVERGEDPQAREVLVGGRRMPYWNAGPMYAPWAGGYFGGFGGGLFPGLMVGTLLGEAIVAPMAWGGGWGDAGGWGGDFGGGDFGGGDFGGGDFGGGDFGGGDFGGGDFGGGDF